MEEMRGITVQIPVELHNQVRTEQVSLGITMNQYIKEILTEHFIRREEKYMGPTKTLSFEVPEDFFKRIKDHLKKINMSQKKFVIGLIKDELERFEQSEKTREDEKKGLAEDSQEAAEGPLEDELDSDEAVEETAQNVPCDDECGEQEEEDSEDEMGLDEDESIEDMRGQTGDEEYSDDENDEDEDEQMSPVM